MAKAESAKVGGFKGAPDSVALILFFVFWYAGNMKYNEYNTASLAAVGGKFAGMTMIVATLQLGVCGIYALAMWILNLNPVRLFGLQLPTKQNVPKLSSADVVKTVPLGFCSAAAHACTVFALGGDPLFGQIVKSGEPVMAAIINTIVYNKRPSFPKIMCLPIIVGGVAFASLKKGGDGSYALKFDQTALVFGMLANTFAAFKGGENKKTYVRYRNRTALWRCWKPVCCDTDSCVLYVSSCHVWYRRCYVLYIHREANHRQKSSVESMFVWTLLLPLQRTCYNDPQGNGTRNGICRKYCKACNRYGLHGCCNWKITYRRTEDWSRCCNLWCTIIFNN